MLLRVLKKDMKRKMGVNIILFLFIVMATIFVASSVNNMMTVSNATEYFMDKAAIPDEFIGRQQIEGDTQVADWLDSQSGLVKKYSSQDALLINSKKVLFKIGDEKNVPYETNSTIFLEANTSDYVKLFDQKGNQVTIEEGEVAVLASEAKLLGLKAGDQLLLDTGEKTCTYTIGVLTKDALFVGNMANMIRFVFNEKDFEKLQTGSSMTPMDIYYIETDDIEEFDNEFAMESFAGNPNTVSRDTVKLLYVMDMVVAEMLTAIGICLIIIAVLVLRFTIVFTIQEEYREIGIMKAIGVRGFGIKKIYLVKYFALVLLGAAIGCAISFPVGDFMLQGVSSKMIMEDSSVNGILNIGCALAIIMVVMALCYLSMRKLNKMTVMDAIRSGQTGERYRKKSVLKLYRSKKLPTPFFLAVNDILSNVKQYIVLLLVFALGIVLIIIPINTMNTMKSTEMSDQFLLDGSADAFITGVSSTEGTTISSVTQLLDTMDEVEENMKEKGYSAKISAITMMSLPFSTMDGKHNMPVTTIRAVGDDGSFMTYTDGMAPVLENEIAMSKKVLEQLELSIGDSVKVTVGGEEKTFIVTGSYQDYCQIGESARINPKLDITNQYVFGYWNMPVHLNNGLSHEENYEALVEAFPEYQLQTAQDIVNANVGGIVDVIDGMRIWLALLMAGVNMIITILMMRMFMMREKGEIAMLRSIGFKNRSIRQWQILRIALLLVIAVVLAIPLSRLMDVTVLAAIFGIMGAQLNIQVVPLEVYVLYPAILLAGILLAAAYAARAVKKIDIREINNLE